MNAKEKRAAPLTKEEKYYYKNKTYLKRAMLRQRAKTTEDDIQEAKERLGKELARIRSTKEISKYAMAGAGCPWVQLNCIEQGSRNYTIDPLLSYINMLGFKIVLKPI